MFELKSFIFHRLNIRQRIILFFFSLVLIVLMLLAVFGRIWFVDSISQFEKYFLERSYKSVMSSLNLNKKFLSLQVLHYSTDPQVVGFFSENMDKRAGNQFLTTLKKKLNLDLLIILDIKGDLLAKFEARGLDYLGVRGLSGSGFKNMLLSNEAAAGFWHDKEDKLWFLALSPIVVEGNVSRKLGFLVFGFLIDENPNKLFLNMESDVDVNFLHFSPTKDTSAYNKLSLSDSAKNSSDQLIATQSLFLIDTDALDSGKGKYHLDTLTRNINGDVFGIMRIRNAMNYSVRPMSFFIFFIYLFLGLLVSSIWWFLGIFDKNINSPLLSLREMFSKIAISKDLSKRLDINAMDEMGILFFEVNHMLEELEVFQKKTQHSKKEITILYNDLLDQKKFTSEILATAPSIILVLLPDGRVKYVNDAIEPLLGYKSEEVAGRDWFDYFIPFAQRGELRNVFNDIVKQVPADFSQYENNVLAKDGTEKAIMWNNSLVRDIDGKVLAVIAIGQDRSAQKKTEGELAKRVRDLERFFKISMDRERAIINLKNEIKELKAKIAHKE